MKKENQHPINLNRRKILGLAGAAIPAALISPLLSKAQPVPVIEAGSNVDTVSYVIFQDNGTIYAKNGMTGKIAFQGSDAATVINNAMFTLGSFLDYTSGCGGYGPSSHITASEIKLVNGEYGDGLACAHSQATNFTLGQEIYLTLKEPISPGPLKAQVWGGNPAHGLSNNGSSVCIQASPTVWKFTITEAGIGSIFLYGSNGNPVFIDVSLCSNKRCGFNDTVRGGVIHIKKGLYHLDKDISIGSNVIFQGEGANTIFDLAPHGHILVHGKSNVRISDILVDGAHQTIYNDPPAGNTGCISVVDSNNILVDNVVIRDTYGFGINIVAIGQDYTPASSSGITIQNSLLNGLGNNDVIGGGTAYNQNNTLSNVTIQNNTIIQDGGIGAKYPCCIDLVAIHQFKIINNTTYGVITPGGENYPNNFSIISGNIVYPAKNTNFTHITVWPSGPQWFPNPDPAKPVDSILVTNNIVENGQIRIVGDLRTTPSIYAQKCTITNNIIKGNSVYSGIYAKWMKFCNISNNTIYSAKPGIYLINVIKSKIKDNVIVDCATSLSQTNSSENIIVDNIGYVTKNNGVAMAISDGGVIAHGLVSIPTKARLTGTVAGEIVTIVSLNAVNIIVAIKKPDSSSGTPQTIHWKAEV